MTDTGAPTLEDLRLFGGPAWLWDSERARAVWANAAGLAYFGCETLFDLVDSPFDGKEPGVQRIAAIGANLRRGQTVAAQLAFPSTGSPEPVSCKCYLHALPDGRQGVLVVGQAPGEARQEVPAEDFAAAFDFLPGAAFLASRDGNIGHANQAALAMFGRHRVWSFGGLLGDEARAAQLLTRLDATNVFRFAERLPTVTGPRDLRIAVKRTGPVAEDASRILILVDDVTDRRALERRLQGSVATAPSVEARFSPEDEAAFVAIGKTLKGDVSVASALAEKVRPSPKAPEVADVPGFVSAAIDARPGAQIVARDGIIVHANNEALKLIGVGSVRQLAEKPGLVDKLIRASAAPHARESVFFDAAVTRAQIPWLNGPADCFSITLQFAPPRDIATTPEHTAVASPVEPPIAAVVETIPPALETISIEPAPAEQVTIPESRASEPVAVRQDARDDELRAILDTATDGIVTLDGMGRIKSFSAGAEAIFGYRTAEVADRPFAELLTFDSRKTLRDYLAALEGPGLAAVFNDGREVSATVKQGGEVPLFMTIGRLQTSGGTSAAFCAVLRDITQWKKTEKDLREAKDNAELASRQKSEFLAKISHELRTPLNAILGFSEVMRLERFGEIRNDKYRGYVNDIHSSGSHLLSLINDLLDLSKVEAGKLELNFTSVNLVDAADHAIRMTQDLATSGRVIVRKSFPPGLPNVVADQRSMRQILLNLLSNAIKFTDPGGQVIVSAQLSKAGELKLRVKDTGIGMSDSEVKEALEPFRRITTEGRDRQGTGLGLPLTKALAEANRTAFAIMSEPRKGTLVEITFPVTRVLAE